MGINPFTPRFCLEAHNACKTPQSPQRQQAVNRHAPAMLSIDIAEQLAETPGYKDKLALLAVVNGYSSVDDGQQDEQGTSCNP